MGAGPVDRRGDEALLDAVGEDLAEPADLGFGLLRNQDRLIPAPPELLPPANEPTRLTGEIGVEVVHEARQALGAGDGHEQVKVVGEEGEGVDLDRVEPGGAGEDAEGEITKQRRTEKGASRLPPRLPPSRPRRLRLSNGGASSGFRKSVQSPTERTSEGCGSRVSGDHAVNRWRAEATVRSRERRLNRRAPRRRCPTVIR